MEDLLERLKVALADRYAIEHEIGSGGMATVYLAEDLKHHRQVAIKVLKPELAASLGAERFLREIEIAAQLNHPNILTLIDSGKADGLLYYAMPYVEGESLRDRLKREKQLSIEDALQITSEVADALGYAHSLGIVHRDVKPENILFEAGHAVVTDFGIAKAVTEAGGASLTETGLAIGTPAYMSPEQAVGVKDIDARADVYALGCVLFEMLGGEPPFTGVTPQAILARKSVEAVPSVRAVRDTVPDEVDVAITRALAKVPADRFMTVSRFTEALSTPVMPRVSRPGTGRSLAVAGVYTAGSLLVLALVYFVVERLGLPYWVVTAAVVLVVAFLPLALLTDVAEQERVSRRPRTGFMSGLTWRRAGLTMIGGFGLLGAVTAGYATMRSLGIGPAATLVTAGSLPERPLVVVADFENRTADSALGITIAEWLRMDLAASPGVEPLAPRAISSALRRMERDPGARLELPIALEVAEREGAPAVITGVVSSLGSSYVISARLVATADSTELFADRRTAPNDSAIVRAVEQLSAELRASIGEPLRSVRSQESLIRVSTHSVEALRKFTLAVRLIARTGEWYEARRLLEEAVRIDSTFAAAHHELTSMYPAERRWSEWLEAMQAAYRHRHRLPEWERSSIESDYYQSVEIDRVRALAAHESMLRLRPRDQSTLAAFSDFHLTGREWVAAEALARRAVGAGPIGDPSVVWNLVEALAGQGRFTEAEQAVSLLEEGILHHSWRWQLSERLTSAQRDYERAKVLLDSLREVDYRDWLARGGVYALARGSFADAEQYWLEVAEKAEAPTTRLLFALNVAGIRAWYGDTAGALRQVERALAQHPLDSLPPEDRSYLRLARFYAWVGALEQASEHLEEFRESVHVVVQQRQAAAHAATEGAIAFARGDYAQAISSYRRSYDESNCAVCGLYQLGRSYEMIGEADSALAVYERAVRTPGLFRATEESLTLGPTYERLAHLYEQREESGNAIEYYNRFIELWKDADPELQPRVQDARERLASLVAEPQPAM